MCINVWRVLFCYTILKFLLDSWSLFVYILKSWYDGPSSSSIIIMGIDTIDHSQNTTCDETVA